MRIPPPIAAVRRTLAGTPRSDSCTPDGIRPAQAPVSRATGDLENDSVTTHHPDNGRRGLPIPFAAHYRLGNGCDHAGGNFWAWCQTLDTYLCCPLINNHAYQVSSACNVCAEAP